MSTTDLYKTVLFNEGEGVEPDDLNDVQRFRGAQIQDGLLQCLIGNMDHTVNVNQTLDPDYQGQRGANVETIRCYALSAGQAFLRPGTANNKVGVSPGTLFQKLAASDGDEAQLIAYTFDGTEEFLIADGGALNHRVDLLQMKLEYVDGDPETRDFQDAVTRALTSPSLDKKRRVQCTLSIKTGTEASTTAVTYPTPDAGTVPIGAVVVGAGWTVAVAPVFGIDTAAANKVVVHDQRVPLGVRAYRVDPTAFKLVTAWALSNNNSTVTSSNATNLLYVACPTSKGRLVGVAMHLAGSSISPSVSALDAGRSSGIITTTYIPYNSVMMGTSAPDIIAPQACIEQNHVNATIGGGTGPDIIPNVTFSTPATGFGPPIWANGRRCAFEKFHRSSVAAVPSDHLVLRLQSGVNGTVIGAITFYVAEGL